MASITSAALIAAYPQWTPVESGVIDHAVAVANALTCTLYTDSTEEAHRRYLEASAILYDHPKGRSVLKNWPATIVENPYRAEATRLDRLKMGAYRAPGWSLPSGVS